MNRPAPILADYLAAAANITAINPKHQRTVVDWVKAQRQVDFYVDIAAWVADQPLSNADENLELEGYSSGIYKRNSEALAQRREEKWHDKALELVSYMPRRELENATKQMVAAIEASDTVHWADQNDDVSEPDVQELRGSLSEPSDDNERFEDAALRNFLSGCKHVAEARVRAECTRDASDALISRVYLQALSSEAVSFCNAMGYDTVFAQRCVSYRDLWIAKSQRAEAALTIEELASH